ncbi:MAG: hypothetical protein J7496_11690 [Novosphingobium sp.]|nr:hypothetical protein [Novosphingobium sp.]
MSEHCCEMMRSNVENVCNEHPERKDCPDCLLEFHDASNLYGIIVHDGGNSMIAIDYCPWCGSKLVEDVQDD